MIIIIIFAVWTIMTMGCIYFTVEEDFKDSKLAIVCVIIDCLLYLIMRYCI